MTREELEHIIRASGDITDEYEFVVVGSQSMLGPVPNPEEVFTVLTSIPSRPPNWLTGSTAPSAKARRSTRDSATTPRE